MNRHRSILSSCLLFAMTLGGFAAATAQIVPAGPRISISDDLEDLSGRPAVAFDAAGNAAVVWGLIGESTDPDVLQETRIVGRCFGPDGEPLAPPQAVDGGPAESQFDPDVAALGDGRFLVVWSRWAAAYDAFGQVFDLAGERQGPRFRINERTRYWQVFPVAAANRHGEAFVVWPWDDVGDQGPWPQLVSGRRILPDGTFAGHEIQVNRLATSPVPPGNLPPVAVASDPDGESLVVWETEAGIFARRYDRLGRPRGEEVRVDPAEGHVNSTTPAVAADADGNFVVLWAGQESRSRPLEIVARGFSGTGPVGPARTVGVAPFRFGLSPVVTSDADGHFVAAWTSFDAGFTRVRVVLRQLTPDGRPKGAIRVVSQGGGVDVAAGPDGDVLVTWVGPSPNGGAAYRVFGKRFRAQ